MCIMTFKWNSSALFHSVPGFSNHQQCVGHSHSSTVPTAADEPHPLSFPWPLFCEVSQMCEECEETESIKESVISTLLQLTVLLLMWSASHVNFAHTAS